MNSFNSVVPVTESTINGKLQQTVSAKQLHACLNVGNDFSTWIKERINKYGFIKDDDYLVFDSSKNRNQSTKNKQSDKWETARGGDRRSIDYHLTLNMAKELAMIENNEHGRAIRKYFIRCEEHLKEIAPAIQRKELKRLKARIEVADYSRPMRDALTLQRAMQGKETKPHIFTNEFDMINHIVLGTTSSKYKKANNLTGNVRDHLSEFELSHIAYLENSNITLINIGYDYHQRKAELIKLSHAYLIRHMAQVA
ncbi:antA/AntB antirepressor family protein [Orbus wheelerorum]|uniref:antA/AntB antirepressor family protein n=1 Tax=Orbus wheelerorum TaxID=3074111 RepID=UPI00370D52B8